MRTSELFTSFSNRQRDAGCGTRGWGRKEEGEGEEGEGEEEEKEEEEEEEQEEEGENELIVLDPSHVRTYVSSSMYVEPYSCIDLPPLGWDLLNNRWGIMTQVVVGVSVSEPLSSDLNVNFICLSWTVNLP